MAVFLHAPLFAGPLFATPLQIRPCLPVESGAVSSETLHIHLYNLAGLSLFMLNHATQDAAQVLATAGVDTVCWHVLADAPEAHIIDRTPSTFSLKNRQADARGYLVVIIARGFSAKYFAGALGYALPDAQTGVNATIFYDRLERFNESSEIDGATLLGHALAHEIGHVLLGTSEHHATCGIMKTHWCNADFHGAGPTLMNFTALQRAEVLRRRTVAPARLARLEVRIYSHARVAARTISRAQDDVSRVFRRAGIELHWVDCTRHGTEQMQDPSCADGTSAWIRVTVMPKSMISALPLSADPFGIILSTGILAFSDRIREFARSSRFSEEEILAIVLAHEIGHGLLGANHTTLGLMRAQLDRHDLLSFAGGRLGFTPDQASTMQSLLRSLTGRIGAAGLAAQPEPD